MNTTDISFSSFDERQSYDVYNHNDTKFELPVRIAEFQPKSIFQGEERSHFWSGKGKGNWVVFVQLQPCPDLA
jgi:hypothetical protein